MFAYLWWITGEELSAAREGGGDGGGGGGGGGETLDKCVDRNFLWFNEPTIQTEIEIKKDKEELIFSRFCTRVKVVYVA